MKKIIILSFLILFFVLSGFSQGNTTITAGGQEAELIYNQGVQNFLNQDYAAALVELSKAI